jgi:hypothetical protein
MFVNFDIDRENRNKNVVITQDELDKQQKTTRELATLYKSTENNILLYAGIGVGALLLILLLND